ncbi:MAG: hypothetical protein ACAI35_20020 [Candidatus Methylacidiphilales bacterium]|nr:hypothetical protein [Candidatus Methylacidiphilales bacterium]
MTAFCHDFAHKPMTNVEEKIRPHVLFYHVMAKVFPFIAESTNMLPSGTSHQSDSPYDAAPLAHPDAGLASSASSSATPAKSQVPKSKAKSKAFQTVGIMNMKKKAKAKIVVTDDQLDKLADVLCEMFHNEATGAPFLPALKEPKESLTALLA